MQRVKYYLASKKKNVPTRQSLLFSVSLEVMQALTLKDASAKGQLTEKIRQSLECAIDSRGRHYQAVYALSFHFALDQTGGAKDSATFVNIARSLGVEKPQSFSIPDFGNGSGKGPEYAVVQKLWDFISSCAPHQSSEARVLILLHYAGHGKINNKDELVFFADDAYPRSFRFDFTLNPLFTLFAEIPLSKVDAVTILDACHVGIATRSPSQTGRAAEVVSAVRADQHAFSRPNQITFTARLANEIAFRCGRAHASLSFPELVVELQRTSHPDRFPSFKLLSSQTPVRVHLLPPGSVYVQDPRKHSKEQSSSSQGSSSKTIANQHEQHRVIFTVHLPHHPDEIDVRKVTEWIDSLDTNIGLELSGVYRSNSTVLTLECQKTTWYALEGTDGFKHVADVYGKNLRKQEQEPLRELSENLPLQAERSSLASRPSSKEGLGGLRERKYMNE